ncbi:hypothetical protein V5799_000889 [Amblyomma americanum]|uniref:Uncharacterized protein n=1 Tax=Amblyomma americanum TaxID=6943 RepID=A0AAQ4D1S1_AMBAM
MKRRGGYAARARSRSVEPRSPRSPAAAAGASGGASGALARARALLPFRRATPASQNGTTLDPSKVTPYQYNARSTNRRASRRLDNALGASHL